MKRTEENLISVAEDQIAPQIIEAIRADEREKWAIIADHLAQSFRSPNGTGLKHSETSRKLLAEQCEWFAIMMRDHKSQPQSADEAAFWFKTPVENPIAN
jgi:hypothetical protein